MIAMKEKSHFFECSLLRTKFIRRVALLILMSFGTICIKAQTIPAPVSSECSATIIPISSIDNTAVEDILDYRLILKNNGSSKDIFYVKTANFKPETSNPDGSVSEKNLNLESLVLDKNEQAVQQIELEAGSEVEFVVRVLVAEKSRIGAWNSTQISVTSSVCPSVKIFLTLFTYLPLPKNDIQGYIPTTYPVTDLPIKI